MFIYIFIYFYIFIYLYVYLHAFFKPEAVCSTIPISVHFKIYSPYTKQTGLAPVNLYRFLAEYGVQETGNRFLRNRLLRGGPAAWLCAPNHDS